MSVNQLIVVTNAHIKRDVERMLGPKWKVCVIGDALAGHRFDLIIIAASLESRSRAEHEKWQMWLSLLNTKLAPGGRMAEVV